MFKYDTTPTPVNSNLRLMKNKGNHVSQYKYSQVIDFGYLMYVMCCNRSDIVFAIRMLSKYMSNPSSMH